MEEYNQELTDLKELVGKALDKKGTLAKIRVMQTVNKLGILDVYKDMSAPPFFILEF